MDAKEVSPILFLPNRLLVDRLLARRILEVVVLVPQKKQAVSSHFHFQALKKKMLEWIDP